MISLNYDNDFLIFSFALVHTIVVVLLHKNEENQEQPIAFVSKALRDVEMKYNSMEKQAYALVKALKDFKDYVPHSNILAYVPTSTIKEIITQTNNEGRRGKWIYKI